jgi:hypothetical protein
MTGFKTIFRKMLKFAGFLGVAHLFGRRLSKLKNATVQYSKNFISMQ